MWFEGRVRGRGSCRGKGSCRDRVGVRVELKIKGVETVRDRCSINLQSKIRKCSIRVLNTHKSSR